MPSHSEVLPSLPYVCTLPGASLRVRAPGSAHPSLSSFWAPSQAGGGTKKSTLSLSHSFLQLFNHGPHLFWFGLVWGFFFFLYCLFFLGLVLLIPFLYLPHPSSFFVLKYNQECGKLEGDGVWCPSQGGGGRAMPGFRQGWRRGQASPPPPPPM